MKICNNCKLEKSEEEFHKNSKRGLQAYCKSCRKEKDKKYWEIRSQNKEKMQEKREYNKQFFEERRKLIYDYLKNHSCVDCGEKDPVVLTFDHLKDKKFCISIGMLRFSLEKLLEEISKCVIRCANCHMRKTAKDFCWYSYRLQKQGIA